MAVSNKSNNTTEERSKWLLLFLGGFVLLAINGFVFKADILDIEILKYPENFLIALLVVNALISMFCILLATGYKLSVKDGKVNIEEMTIEVTKNVTKEITAKVEEQVTAVIGEEKFSKDTSTNPRGILFDTNKAFDLDAVWQMMENKKVAAYGSIQDLVDKLHQDDIIFFYHSGKGIIAAGRVTEKESHTIPEYKEKYRTVTFLTAIPNKETGIQNFLIPKEITKATGRKFSYIKTIKYPILEDKEKEWEPLLEAVIERVGEPQ